MENTVGCGWGMRLSWALVGDVREGKEETQKHAFRRVVTIYIHYFKDIRQGALQSYCVRFATSSVGPWVGGRG